MNGLQKRGNFMPRRKRERRALRLIATGGIASAVAIVGLALAIAGVVSAALPIVALAVVGVCVYLFRRTVAG
jgi:fatty acid desaturase